MWQGIQQESKRWVGGDRPGWKGSPETAWPPPPLPPSPGGCFRARAHFLRAGSVGTWSVSGAKCVAGTTCPVGPHSLGLLGGVGWVYRPDWVIATISAPALGFTYSLYGVY